jgi:hypothetical protein
VTVALLEMELLTTPLCLLLFLFQTCMGSGAVGLYALAFCCRELVVFATNRGRPIWGREEVEELGVGTAEHVRSRADG